MPLLGTRVVRGPNWRWDEQDSGEGHLGTVVKVGEPENSVVALWDNGNQANYRTGLNDCFDLRVFDSAQAGVTFDLFTCDGCKTTPIQGMRWKCCECHDFDLCTPCYMTDVHSLDHAFQRFDFSNDRTHGVNVGKRRNSTRVQSKGIFKGAKVKRGKDWRYSGQDGGNGMSGTVTELTKWQKARDAANVTWDAVKRSNIYRVGQQGKVDLQFTTAATGPKYYRDHLQKLDTTGIDAAGEEAGSRVLKRGDKVITFLEAETLRLMQDGHGGWNSSMAEIVGKVGCVEKVDADGDVHVKYGEHTWALNSDSIYKVPKLRAGDKVRVAIEREIVIQLQQGHGGWNDTMMEALGAQGNVLEVDGDGDAVVKMGERAWLFNPAALTLETPEAERAPPGTSRTNSSPGTSREALVEALFHSLLTDIALGSGGQLVKSASEGNAQRVREILQKDRSLINHQVGGQSALHLACLKGHPDVVSILLDMGANKEIKDEENRTPLHYAAYGDKLGECIVLLLSANADTNVRADKNGATPLHLAVHRENDAGVCALVQNPHCDVNSWDESGDSPLHDAITLDRDLIVSCIINDARSLDPTVVNKRGFNPLHHACLKGNVHAVTRLIEKFPTLADIVKEDGYSPLHIAAVNDHREIAVALLLSGHCPIDMRTRDGKTALVLAVQEGYTEMIELLVEHGVNVNIPDEDGTTALHLAVMKQFMTNPLAAAIADALGLPARGSGDSATQSATALYLVMHGADVNYRNHSGNTPMDLCLDDQVKSAIMQYVRTSRPPQQQAFNFVSPASPGTFTTGAPFPSLPPRMASPTGSQPLSQASRTPSLPSLPIKSPPSASQQVSRERPLSQISPTATASTSPVQETKTPKKPPTPPKPATLPRTTSAPTMPVAGSSGNPSTAQDVAPRKFSSPETSKAGTSQGVQATKNPTPPPTKPKPSSKEPPPLPPRPDLSRDNKGVSNLVRRFEQVAMTTSSGSNVPEDVNRATNCFICVEEAAIVTFQPCNHKVVCTGCSVRAKQCIVCKRPIERKVTPGGESVTGPALTNEQVYLRQFERLERKVEELQRQNECSICMERDYDTVFQCGHKFCNVCAARVTRCPNCNRNITDRRKIY